MICINYWLSLKNDGNFCHKVYLSGFVFCYTGGIEEHKLEDIDRIISRKVIANRQVV